MQGISQHWYPSILGNLLLASSYTVLAYLALLLAIPPGYASAVFPASGVALAALLMWGYRFAPGVWLGSFAMNAWITTQQSPGLELSAFLVPAAIATGATLQALLGARLAQVASETPGVLADDRAVLRLLGLGGPVACVTSATVGVTALWYSGTIEPTEWMFSWWTWWIGDTLGVLLLTPVMFTLFAKPRHLWQRRLTTVLVPLVLVLVGVVFIFLQASRWETERIRDEFDEQAAQLAHRLESQLAMYVQILSGLERFYAASNYVSRDEFHRFVAGHLQRHPNIQALTWLPAVQDTARASFEASVQAEGFPDFTIRERAHDGQLVPAARRPLYFPVTYINPVDGNESAMGFDVFSENTRRAALEKARDSGGPAATAPILLVQDNNALAATLIFQPVYRRDALLTDDDTRRDAVDGVLSLVLRFSDVIETDLKASIDADYDIALFDVTDPSRVASLYGKSPPPRVFSRDLIVTMAERQLKLVVATTPDYLAKHRGWQSWTMLAVGLFATSILGAFLLSVTGRAEATRQLVEHRTRELRGILANALDAIITIDAQGIIQSANPAAERLFSYSIDEMVGADLSVLMPSPVGEPHHADIAEYLQSGDANVIGRRREMVGRRKDGTTLPIEVGVSEVRLDDKVFFTAIVHDLTDRRRVEKLQSEFISTVSHELRTPLTSIRGSLALLTGGILGELNEDSRNLVRLAASNAERLTLLINDILDIEKLEAGYLRMSMLPMDLLPLVRKAIDDASGYARQCGIHLSLRGDPAGLAVTMVDPDRFQQVMANLLSNAIKYSPQGGTVDVDLKVGPQSVWVGVADHGPGIPSEFCAQVFRKFARADTSDSRRLGGTGLGLSIAKAIVEKMGGEIGFDTREGGGSTFYFTLPRAPAKAA